MKGNTITQISPVTVVDSKGEIIGTYDLVTELEGKYWLAISNGATVFVAANYGEGILAPANWESLIPSLVEPEWGIAPLKAKEVIYYPHFSKGFLEAALSGKAPCPDCGYRYAVLMRERVTYKLVCTSCDRHMHYPCAERVESFNRELESITLEAHY